MNPEGRSGNEVDYWMDLGYRIGSYPMGSTIRRHVDYEAFHAMLKSIVKPVENEVPGPLARLHPEMLLTVEEVLAYLPVRISRRGWLEGARTGRYPAAIHINRKTLRWKARDIQQYVTLLLGALDAGEDRR